MVDVSEPAIACERNSASPSVQQLEDTTRPEGAPPKSAPLVLVVDRHEFVRSCLISWLRTSCPELEVVPAFSADSRFESSQHERPSAAILGDDISEHRFEWIEQQSAFLRASFPDLPIAIVVRTEKASSLAATCNRLGLQGYVPASTSSAVAAAAIRLIVAGGTYFPRSREREGPSNRHRATPGQGTIDPDAAKALSDRERAVVDLIRRGMPNKIIAYELNISVSTVKAHMHRIIHKLNVKNRTELAVMARTVDSEPRFVVPALGREIALS